MREDRVKALREEFHFVRGDLAIGDGWYDLFHKFCTKLAALNPDEHVRLAQVKEKFGGLRVYVQGLHDDAMVEAVDLLTQEAEMASLNTCEDCGAPGQESDVGGWTKTVCEADAARRNVEH